MTRKNLCFRALIAFGFAAPLLAQAGPPADLHKQQHAQKQTDGK